jgi:hypothetical protein
MRSRQSRPRSGRWPVQKNPAALRSRSRVVQSMVQGPKGGSGSTSAAEREVIAVVKVRTGPVSRQPEARGSCQRNETHTRSDEHEMGVVLVKWGYDAWRLRWLSAASRDRRLQRLTASASRRRKRDTAKQSGRDEMGHCTMVVSSEQRGG